MEVRTSNCDIGSLRRYLDNIGVRVEEVTELTVWNQERLWRCEIRDSRVVVERDERIRDWKNTVTRGGRSERAIALREKRRSRARDLIQTTDVFSQRRTVIGGREISCLWVERVKDEISESERSRHFEREEGSNLVGDYHSLVWVLTERRIGKGRAVERSGIKKDLQNWKVVVSIGFIFAPYLRVMVSLVNDVVSSWSEINSNGVIGVGSSNLICFGYRISQVDKGIGLSSFSLLISEAILNNSMTIRDKEWSCSALWGTLRGADSYILSIQYLWDVVARIATQALCCFPTDTSSARKVALLAILSRWIKVLVLIEADLLTMLRSKLKLKAVASYLIV